MKSLIAAICIAALPNLGGAESLKTIFVDVTEETTIDGYLWVKRPVIIFANTDLDVNFQTQMKSLRQGAEELAARDVVVLVDTNPANKTALRKRFRPRGFAVLLMGKDGQIKLRKPFPWDARELSRSIDKMPMRQQEMRSK
tara:strand:- start:639 stop:1061 length:423 start_codon:yes stop_codon:yes gene_type:complete